MYSQDKIDVALKVFHQCGSVTTTIRVLGYPTRRALYTWIANEGSAKSERKPLKLVNTAEHPRNPPVEVKMDAIGPRRSAVMLHGFVRASHLPVPVRRTCAENKPGTAF